MQDQIVIEGARQHNLRGISLEIPRGRLVVFCGVSGSGKSSLVFDTIYAYGQRRFLESLSARARALLGQTAPPQVDRVVGLSPTIAIDQRSAASAPRSTVASLAEVSDLLRLAWARAGDVRCPGCGEALRATSAGQLATDLFALPERTRYLLLAPLVRETAGDHAELLADALARGFVRARVDGEVLELGPGLALDADAAHTIELVIDRLVAKPGIEGRVAGSVEAALEAGGGELAVLILGRDGAPDRLERHAEALLCTRCGERHQQPTPAHLSHNSPRGMCSGCRGSGEVEGLVPERLLDAAQPLEKGAVRPWARRPPGWVRPWLEAVRAGFELPAGAPWGELSAAQRRAVLHGDGRQLTLPPGDEPQVFPGLLVALERRWQSGAARSARAFAPYVASRPCGVCGGSRLGPLARSVELGGVSLGALMGQTVAEASAGLEQLGGALSGLAAQVAAEPLAQARRRLALLERLGLGYLELGRGGGSLSAGEARRVRLAGSLGGGLAGVCYVLDEPTAGLHPRDGDALIATLLALRDEGNSVLAVEHDADAIRAADHVVEIGPLAGERGGELVYAGDVAGLLAHPSSLTGGYLSGRLGAASPQPAPPPTSSLRLRGVTRRNLRGLDVELPLGQLVALAGVSGAGKSTLAGVVSQAIASKLAGEPALAPGALEALEGAAGLTRLVEVDQRPIGAGPKSCPATYTQLMVELRKLFANQKEARVRGFDASRFSFNRKGGRCEVCSGEGMVKVEMDFLPDVYTACPTCDGARYNPATLRVRHRGASIADVLAMTVSQAAEHFSRNPAIHARLQLLADVGLGYLRLGQPGHTLSGGEAQRLKLARELVRSDGTGTLVILDEPTLGLHPHDVFVLIGVLRRLVASGASVLVVEHHLRVLAAADWIVELGPEGGPGGGQLIAAGTPVQVAEADTPTAPHLRARLEASP